MHRIVPISDPGAPELRVFRTLRRPVEHFREGLFVAEGSKVVRRLLTSPLRVHALLVTPEWLEALRHELETRPEPLTAYVAARGALEEIVGFHLHQGVMALGQVPAPASLGTLTALPAPHLFVALDGLTNAENIGVLVRNAAAFGAQGIIVGETSSSPYLRRAVRNSMGTVFGMPVVHTEDLAATIGELRTHRGVRVIGAHPHAEQRALPATDLTRSCCFVFGSEGEGLSEGILRACDEAVAVPMAEGVDSMNVASAAAVFLYEAYRQRRG